MYKDTSYKEKFALLNDWLSLIVDSVKKELKNEHLKKDIFFVKKFLNSKNLNKISTDDLTEAYQQAITEEEKGEEIAEFITSRWLLKNSELYEFFETRLSQINPNFSDLEELTADQAAPLMNDSVSQFGAPQTYIFAVLNSVVFPKDIYHQLEGKAKQQSQAHIEQTNRAAEQLTLENMKSSYDREMARLTDKYEKKLSGLQKKYLTDVEMLKKQISNLQKKLLEKKH
ncbi:MAG: hypothetical protein H0V82_11320 [Candidatus Protochlamydia sp.]|nr:hypothetical protein [Candidatus Protochlamydia sp.]